MDSILAPENDNQKPIKESFEDHVIVLILPSGEGEYPTAEIQCLAPQSDKNMCNVGNCEMQTLYAMVGWDAIRSAGDIKLARLSARIDWTVADEAWIDVEP